MLYTFILVEPAVAENVGASARALKTMGFNRLVIVNSQVHKQPEARWLAHGSTDILDNIEVFRTLEEAVKDMDMVIGTTAKKRRVHTDYYFCTEIPGLIKSKATMLENVALVFGREESGLTNEELKLCNVFTGVPMKTKYPSLNLGQSVMIYAWELSESIPAKSERVPINPSKSSVGSSFTESPVQALSRPKLRHFRKMSSDILMRIGYEKESAVFCRIKERLEMMSDKDAGLVMSVFSKLKENISDINDEKI